MRPFSKLVVAAAAVSAVQAADPSLCEKYTTALLKQNTVQNQLKLLTLVVNTAVIGNYTQPNMNAVPGILSPNATYNGKSVNLAPYFSGDLASSNRNGSKGVSINFLDGGGANPLKMNMPAMQSAANSTQAKLLNHLYQYFGALLGCSGDFPKYAGKASQYEVHKYMALTNDEVQYFIQQVGLSAKSFGVTDEDVAAVGKKLNTAFGYRCSPPTEIIPGQGTQLQSICIDESCPADPKAMCDAYSPVVKPQKDNSTSSAMPSRSMTSSSSMPSDSMTSSSSMPSDSMTSSSMPSGSPGTTSSSAMPASTSRASANMLGASYGAALLGAAAIMAL